MGDPEQGAVVEEDAALGEVAAVEGNAVARVEAGLREQRRGTGRRVALADLEHSP